MKEGIAKIGAMNEEIVPELAKQMGCPIRYAAEFAGVEQRALYMADIAHSALLTSSISLDQLGLAEL